MGCGSLELMRLQWFVLLRFVFSFRAGSATQLYYKTSLSLSYYFIYKLELIGYLPRMVVTWITWGESGQIPSTSPGIQQGPHEWQFLPSSLSMIIVVIMVNDYY